MANPFSTELHNWFWAKDFGISGFFMLVVVVVGLFIFFVVVTNPINYLDPFFHLLIHPFHPFFLYFNFICFILPVILVPFINDLNSFFPSLFFELLFLSLVFNFLFLFIFSLILQVQMSLWDWYAISKVEFLLLSW